MTKEELAALDQFFSQPQMPAQSTEEPGGGGPMTPEMFALGALPKAKRRLASAVSGGLTERILPPAARLGPSSNWVESGLDIAGETLALVPAIRALRGIPWAAKTAQALPRLFSIGEGFLTSAGQEALKATTAGKEGGEIAEQALTGGLIGAAPETIFRGIGAGYGAIKKGVIGPSEKGIVPRAMRFIGLHKDPIRKKLAENLARYDITPFPGSLRPNDPIIDLVEQRGARTITARPLMQTEGYEKAQKGIAKFQRDVALQAGPERGVGMQNVDVGRKIKGAFDKRLDDYHDRASELYETTLDAGLRDYPIDPQRTIVRLTNFLEDQGFDPKATQEFPGANMIMGVINDLKKLAIKSPDLYGPTGELIRLEQQFQPTTYGWLWNRSKKLFVKPKNLWTSDDFVKAEARDILVEELGRGAREHSDEAAAAILEANKNWAAYRAFQRDELGKKILTTKSDNLVNSMFRSVDDIDRARVLLGAQSFDLARQQYLMNIMFKAEKKAIGQEARAILQQGPEKEIDIERFLTAVRNAGGIDGERFKALFKDAPEKFRAFVDLTDTLEGIKDSMALYRGRGETPGGPETRGLWTIIKTLFSAASFIPHVALGRKLGVGLTRSVPESIYLGGAPPVHLPTAGRQAVQSVAARRITGQPEP